MGDFYRADIRQSSGETVTFLVRYSKPSDPIYQEGALVYSDRIKYGDVDRLDNSIAGRPCIGIEFDALNHACYGEDETFLEPTSINNIPDGIKWIGDNVFEQKYGSVKLPDSVEYLGKYCFAYTHLENILLPSGIRSMGERCFYSTNLKEIVIPGNLTEIPEGCFSGHMDLKKIYINEGVRSIGKYGLISSGYIDDTKPDGRIVILPRSIALIDDTALGGSYFRGTVYAYPGSYAFFWAKEHNYHVEAM